MSEDEFRGTVDHLMYSGVFAKDLQHGQLCAPLHCEVDSPLTVLPSHPSAHDIFSGGSLLPFVSMLHGATSEVLEH